MDNLYTDHNTDTTADSIGYADLHARMDRIDSALRTMQKKSSRKKKGSGKIKKLKRRLQVVEIENEQFKYLFQALAMQQQQKKGGKKKKKHKKQKLSSAWWQDGIVASMPIVLNNLTRPDAQMLPKKSQLYLDDGKGRK